MRENSLQPPRNTCSSPEWGFRFPVTWRYRLARSIPARNRSSNSTTLRSAARVTAQRRKIRTQEAMDARTRASMTSCTRTLAPLIRCHIDICSACTLCFSSILHCLVRLDGLESLVQGQRYHPGFVLIGTDTGHQHFPLTYQPAIGSPYLLSEADAGTLEFQDTGRHHNFIVQLPRSMLSGPDGVDAKRGVVGPPYAPTQ